MKLSVDSTSVLLLNEILLIRSSTLSILCGSNNLIGGPFSNNVDDNIYPNSNIVYITSVQYRSGCWHSFIAMSIIILLYYRA